MFGSQNNSVGVLGLGIIGSRVAERLRNADFNVYVWNRSIKPEPNFMASPAEVAEVASVIQIFVRDAEALIAVMEDMKPALTSGHVVMCHSTVNARAIRRAADIAANRGAGFLDAPFTGSKGAAEKGDLVYYIGGEAAPLERAKKVLAVSGKQILPLGKAGDATVLKIATNLISAAVVEALAEAMAITKAEGIDISKLQEALAANANSSPLINMKLPTMAARSYAPHFSLKNMLKDARYAQAIADEQGLALPVLNATAQAMDRGVRGGQADFDYSVVLENFTPMLRAIEERAARSKPKVQEPGPATPAETATAPQTAELESPKKDAAPADEKVLKPEGLSELPPASAAAETTALEAKAGPDSKPDDKSIDAPAINLEKDSAQVVKTEDPAGKDVKETADQKTGAEAKEPPSGLEEVKGSNEKLATNLGTPEPKTASDPTKAGDTLLAGSSPSQGKEEDKVTKPEAPASKVDDAPAKSGAADKAESVSTAEASAAVPDTAVATSEKKAVPDVADAQPSGKQDAAKAPPAGPPVEKKPSFVSRLFGGFKGKPKQEKANKAEPAKPAETSAPSSTKEAVAQDKTPKPKDKSKKDENRDELPKPPPAKEEGHFSRHPDGPMAAVLAKSESTQATPVEPPKTDKFPTLPKPPISLPPAPIRAKKKPGALKTETSRPATLVAKLLSDTDVEPDQDEEPASLKIKLDTDPGLTSKPIPLADGGASRPSNALASAAENLDGAGAPPSVTLVAKFVSDTGSDAAETMDEGKTQTPPTTTGDQPSGEEPKAPPAAGFDESKSTEDLTRELNEKLSTFPKIRERTLPRAGFDTPPDPEVPASPPPTRLEVAQGVIVPNLAPPPPPTVTMPAVASAPDAPLPPEEPVPVPVSESALENHPAPSAPPSIEPAAEAGVPAPAEPPAHPPVDPLAIPAPTLATPIRVKTSRAKVKIRTDESEKPNAPEDGAKAEGTAMPTSQHDA